MALPLLKLELNNSISGLPEEGKLVYVYNSFYNLQNPNPSENQSLLGLNISKENAGIEIDKPVQLETEVCYDDSVNLIITDKVNPPKIVNSRFYQTSSLNYKIADTLAFHPITNPSKTVVQPVSIPFFYFEIISHRSM